jgi:hypothetical protein
MTDLFDTHRVIDVDTHLTEPPDTWTRSFPASKHNIVPHIERIDGVDVWMADGERLGARRSGPRAEASHAAEHAAL